MDTSSKYGHSLTCRVAASQPSHPTMARLTVHDAECLGAHDDAPSVGSVVHRCHAAVYPNIGCHILTVPVMQEQVHEMQSLHGGGIPMVELTTI
jgi:hypothetical protein